MYLHQMWENVPTKRLRKRILNEGSADYSINTQLTNLSVNVNVVWIPSSQLMYLQQMWKTCCHEASEEMHSQRGHRGLSFIMNTHIGCERNSKCRCGSDAFLQVSWCTYNKYGKHVPTKRMRKRIHYAGSDVLHKSWCNTALPGNKFVKSRALIADVWLV